MASYCRTRILLEDWQPAALKSLAGGTRVRLQVIDGVRDPLLDVAGQAQKLALRPRLKLDDVSHEGGRPARFS